MAKKTGRKKEESLVMVGPGADDEDETLDQSVESDEDESEEVEDGGEEESDPRRKKTKSKSDENSDEDGDSDEEDERVGHGEDDEEDDEAGKSRKNERESRKARRERQRRARQRNEVELAFLRQQNDQLERKLSEVASRVEKTEVGSIDQRITSIQSQLKVADQVFAKAVAAGDEDDIATATNIRDRLKDTLGRLNGAKQELTSRSEESAQETQVDSRLVFHASNWMKEHNWYDPKGVDKDSRRVAAIDTRLVQEGYDPRSPEYWDELTDRVREALPHRFKDRRNARDDDDDDDESEDARDRRADRRGSGPRFSTGGRERPLRKNEVYVSPERKQALIDAGVWDDPVLRTRYLKRYKEYDQTNGSRSRSAR
jgi:hypothetical protein